ncbi:hypothetical protein [Klebsiella phage 05F01]|nr:hypothetical protein [Klebsiella phage 05F01]
MVYKFYGYWFDSVFKPYLDFVYIENLGLATIFTAFFMSILLGIFYKPDKSLFGKYLLPVFIIAVSSLLLPILSILLCLILPGVLILSLPLALFLGSFLITSKLKVYLIRKKEN